MSQNPDTDPGLLMVMWGHYINENRCSMQGSRGTISRCMKAGLALRALSFNRFISGQHYQISIKTIRHKRKIHL